MADTRGLGPRAERRAGSSPVPATYCGYGGMADTPA